MSANLRRLVPTGALLVLLASTLPLAGSNQGRPGEGQAVKPASSSWAEIDRLVSEQKFEEAARKVADRREAAQKAGDETEWTKALIREVQLRTGLHGYETAVRFLKDQPWPKGLLPRAALQLFYAQSLTNYARVYSWEIRQRERVESTGKVDLKAWTAEQIAAEATGAYLDLWAQREALGQQPVGSLSEFLDPNDYPKGIRDTLRDALSYLFAAHLSDTAGWTPSEANEVYRVDLGRLLAMDAASSTGLVSSGAHPIERVTAVLADLEAWHAGRSEKEGAFEARLERLRKLFAALTEEADRQRIVADLEGRLASFRDVPWFAMGKAQLAIFVERPGSTGDLARAKRIAEEGLAAYPASVGGRQCKSVVERIAAPDYRLEAMASDGPGKRSIRVFHKNVARLKFRAYPFDLAARIEAQRGQRDLFPTTEEMNRMVDRDTAAAEWTVELPATPDFKIHATFVVPPLKDPGVYVVAASGAAAFGGAGYPLAAASVLVSDLVLVLPGSARRNPDRTSALEVQALSGQSGRPIENVDLAAYRVEWNPERIVRIAAGKTDAKGMAVLQLPEEQNWANRFVFGRRGADLAVDRNGYYPTSSAEAASTTSSLVFTDRSIYRPQQRIFWKVLAYRGEAGKGRLETYPSATLAVSLYDQNNQKVEERSVTANAFGSVAGEFSIPSGRALGAWRVQSSLGNVVASVRVEEYKRPTFEVSFKDPSEPLRLNRAAKLTGEARYYFGLPVASGTARWRVTRTPQWFWWSPWWGVARAGNQRQTVAAGASPLQADGTFSVGFTPSADERLGKDLTYTYAVEADVADEGGETRSASRSFRLGFVSVEARVDAPKGFLREGQADRVTVVRTSLDGVPKPGKGSWRLMKLEQPAAARLPADEPADPPADPAALRTPGDRQRARWETFYSPDRTVRRWKDGGEVARGDLVHDAKGEASIALPALTAGAYRLRYQTADEFGAAFEMPHELFVGGASTPLALPAVLVAEAGSVPVGGTARFLVASGLPAQTLYFDVYRSGRRVERRTLQAGRGSSIVEIPVAEKDRGGFGVKLTVLSDHQLLVQDRALFVPWDDKELKVTFETFRDRLKPGARETWKVKVAGPKGSEAEPAAAELLAYMYDRSLDAFVPHYPANPLSLYPNRTGVEGSRSTLGETGFSWIRNQFSPREAVAMPHGDVLKFYSGYPMGGAGRGRMLLQSAPMPASAPASAGMVAVNGQPAREEVSAAMKSARSDALEEKNAKAAEGAQAPEAIRSEFAETAFWKPQLLTGSDGTAAIEFTVPDSVTSWNVFVHAVTRDWKAGSLRKETKSVKELMVRPYVPRFLREGDVADLKVVVNNASEKAFSGRVVLDVFDPSTSASALADFGLTGERATAPFTAAAGGGANVTFRLAVPKKVGLYAFKVTAAAGDYSDGELRPVPLLPGRMHLMQSRFVTLQDRDRRELVFADLLKNDDPTRLNEQMVVTVDAQLFYSLLQALPYLVNYPYECTEQTLNRFVSTGIVSSLFRDYPAVAQMAAEMSKRDTRLETWDTVDPNRKMALEETPWLEAAKGGRDTGLPLSRVLDPRVAKAERETSLAKLRKAQTASGGFPWWPGGPPSTYMTVYLLHGFANALEFGVEVPKDLVQRAWAYVGSDVKRDLELCMHGPGLCHFATFINYTLSSYPDDTWYKPAFDEAYRKKLLDYSFSKWKLHPPYLKGQLALTLKRAGRGAEAKLVWDSVMDSAKTERDLGTYWAPEDRSWLWYNDTIETQAFALRTLAELDPADPRRAGLVQWLFLNKKLNQWKSTRATAEVIYSVAWSLKKEGALGIREDATVSVAGQKTTFVFEPDRYTGKQNQVVVPGDKLDPKTAGTIVVEKDGKGLAFASATWHFSTEKLPEEDRGDFFAVSRKYFRREATPQGFVLKPLADGVPVSVGDEIEVQIWLRSKHAAEYVHLRDPRAAGLEPGLAVSRYKWDLGIAWYEETRDSGSNFFFEGLPAGEYTFKYRLRANMAGTFKVAPATVQSMYAPEFAAYSAGAVMTVR